MFDLWLEQLLHQKLEFLAKMEKGPYPHKNGVILIRL